MSFGPAVSRRAHARQIDTAAPCPCGSGEAFGGCCGPALRGDPTPTAERLMRSRYTAFSLGDVSYLTSSWHPRTRPETVEADAGLRWTGLEILGVEGGELADATGVVTFTATWSDGATSGVLRERSRFVRELGRWWYVDGELGREPATPSDPATLGW